MRRSLYSALVEAIKRSDLGFLQRLWLRGLIAVSPGLRDAVLDYLREMGVDEPGIAAPDWEKIIDKIIELLPEIIKFIELLIGLFPSGRPD